MAYLSLSRSIQACRQLTVSAHSNFVPAFALLPEEKRQAMEILYAYTRYTDDLADKPEEEESAGDSTESLDRKREKLRQWLGALESVLGKPGEPPPPWEPSSEESFQAVAQRFPGCSGILYLPALKMVVEKYAIPRESLFQLMEGVLSDMEPKPFADMEASEAYCRRVAVSVGMASLAVWGTTVPLDSEPLLRAAAACGLAFQWTNIVRDLREDYRNGRIYLPQSDLAQFGLTPPQFGTLLGGTLLGGGEPDSQQFSRQFSQLLSYQLERGGRYYRESLPLYGMIHPDSRRTFGLMWHYYYSLYRKIVRRPLLVCGEARIRLSVIQKASLWLRWRFLPLPTPARMTRLKSP